MRAAREKLPQGGGVRDTTQASRDSMILNCDNCVKVPRAENDRYTHLELTNKLFHVFQLEFIRQLNVENKGSTCTA